MIRKHSIIKNIWSVFFDFQKAFMLRKKELLLSSKNYLFMEDALLDQKFVRVIYLLEWKLPIPDCLL